ncbi:MAG: hypothetical protein ACR2PS_01120 [Pseudomonadales bacterium]
MPATITTDIVTKVGTWAVIALLGYTVSSTQDRYTATTAANDRAEMRAYIASVMKAHTDRGPHDKVEKRLIHLELGQKRILEKLEEIPRK